MTHTEINDKNKSDIIDIDPETVIENEAAFQPLSPPKKPSKLGVYGLVALAMLTCAVLGGWFYRDMLSTYLPSDQIGSMNARMEALEATNKTASQKLDAIVGFTDEIRSQLAAAQTAAEEARKLATGTKSETAANNLKLIAVEKSLADAIIQLGELKNKIFTAPVGNASKDSTALLARLGTLEKSVNSTRQNTAIEKANVAQLTQAVSHLSEKIVIGASFKDELQNINQMIPSAEGLDILSSNYDKGVATQAQLIKAIHDVGLGLAPKIETTPAPQDNSWWGTTTSIFSGLVTIKTADAVDWQDLAVQCGGLVEQGHIADAILLLNQNLDSLPKPLQEWRIMAAKRLSVDTAFEQVNRAVSREIAARG